MIKTIVLLFSASLLSFYSTDNQSIKEYSTIEQTDHSIVYIYTWGIIENPVLQTKCAIKLQSQYGFGYQSQGSCMMDDIEKLRHFNAHNREVYTILEERHGIDWQERFDEKMEECEAQ